MTVTQRTIPGKYPAYVYRCEHKETKRFYIGYREANHLPAHQDLGKFYFTSSKIVSKNFSDYNFEILAEYDTGKMAFDVEQRLLYELRDDPYLINTSPPTNSKKLIPADLDIFSQELSKSELRKSVHDEYMEYILKGMKILLRIKLTTLKKKKILLRNKNLEIVIAAEKFLAEKFSISVDQLDGILKYISIKDNTIIFSINLKD
jgi:hypothetical protein